MSGQVGAYIGVAVFIFVGLALAYLGYSRYKENRSNLLWLYTALSGLLAAVGFTALLIIALV